MPLRNRTNAVGSLGAIPTIMRIGPIGGANLIGGATPLTANATTDFQVVTVPCRGLALQATVSYTGTQVASPGTILMSIAKKRGATTTVLTGTTDIVALAPNTGSTVKPLSTNSDATNAFEVGDILILRFVSNNATISQQPGGLTVGIQFVQLS